MFINYTVWHIFFQLGYGGVMVTYHGDSEVGRVEPGVTVKTEAVECEGGETGLGDCRIRWQEGGCPAADVAVVRCRPDAAAGCEKGQVAALGSCYQVYIYITCCHVYIYIYKSISI